MTDFQTLLDRYNTLKGDRLNRKLMEEQPKIDPESNLATHFETGKWNSHTCVAAILDRNLRVLEILYENGIQLTEACFVEAARMGYMDIFEFLLGRYPISDSIMEKISNATSDDKYKQVLDCINTVHKYSFLY